MIKGAISIGGESYDLIEYWEDITVSKFAQSLDLLATMTEEIKNHLFDGDSLSHKQKLNYMKFQKSWVGFWTGIPHDLLDKCPYDTKGDLFGINHLFNLLTFTIDMPKDVDILDDFSHEGTNYFRLPDKKIGALTKYIHGASFEEVAEMQQILHIGQAFRKNIYSILPELIATLYRKKIKGEIEAFDEAVCESRYKLFGGCNMDIGWSAFFLLSNLTSSTSEYISRYILQGVKRESHTSFKTT